MEWGIWPGEKIHILENLDAFYIYFWLCIFMRKSDSKLISFAAKKTKEWIKILLGNLDGHILLLAL